MPDLAINRSYMDCLYVAIIGADNWLKGVAVQEPSSLTNAATHSKTVQNAGLDAEFNNTASYALKLIAGLTQITSKKEFLAEDASEIRDHAERILDFLKRDDVQQWIKEKKPEAYNGCITNIVRLDNKINSPVDNTPDNTLLNGWQSAAGACKEYDEQKWSEELDSSSTWKASYTDEVRNNGSAERKPNRPR